ncbi:MAG: GNAT family N-acetyltransferase [Bacteroidales bacterium]
MNGPVNVKLRAPEPEDVECLYKWENDESLWNVSNSNTQLSKYDLWEYLKSGSRDIYETKQLRFIIVDDSPEPVGTIDLFDFCPKNLRAGVGILVYAEKDRRRGVAFAALKELEVYTVKHLNIHQLYANVIAFNEPSIMLFEKAGFEVCGHKKEWVYSEQGWKDELLMQKIF